MFVTRDLCYISNIPNGAIAVSVMDLRCFTKPNPTDTISCQRYAAFERKAEATKIYENDFSFSIPKTVSGLEIRQGANTKRAVSHTTAIGSITEAIKQIDTKFQAQQQELLGMANAIGISTRESILRTDPSITDDDSTSTGLTGYENQRTKTKVYLAKSKGKDIIIRELDSNQIVTGTLSTAFIYNTETRITLIFNTKELTETMEQTVRKMDLEDQIVEVCVTDHRSNLPPGHGYIPVNDLDGAIDEQVTSLLTSTRSPKEAFEEHTRFGVFPKRD
ncbi:hypothetical protein WN48_00829 [Eufriesea mexicana]|nr:hypothetical protein WN48_00829 [Eufriesea mexicana]